jgi:hypothetical protein
VIIENKVDASAGGGGQGVELPAVAKLTCANIKLIAVKMTELVFIRAPDLRIWDLLGFLFCGVSYIHEKRIAQPCFSQIVYKSKTT